MSQYRDRRDPLDPEEMQDASLRKNVFRAIAKDLTSSMKAKVVTDAPGEIARLMEKAFKAGLASHGLDPSLSSTTSNTDRRMTDRDLVPSALQAFKQMRIQGQGKGRAHPHGFPPHAALIMIPRRKHPFSEETKENWYFATRHDGNPYIFSSKAIGPLIKAGLVESFDVPNGTKLARFTEWGFELLVTGSTELPVNREKHRSTTVREWAALLQGDVWGRAAVASNLMRAPSFTAQEDSDTSEMEDSSDNVPFKP